MVKVMVRGRVTVIVGLNCWFGGTFRVSLGLGLGQIYGWVAVRP